jgi:hypothetical protein
MKAVEALGFATLQEHDLSSANLYVQRDGKDTAVTDLHPDDKAYAHLDPKIVLRQHPDAYFRLRVRPADVWQAPATEKVRESLDEFLGPRLPGLPALRAPASGRMTFWGWFAVLTSASNAIALFFVPLADHESLATLQSLGGKPTPLLRLMAGRWFSPLLGILTAVCLVQAFRVPARRKLWITASYLPATLGIAAALVAFYSAYFSVLDNFR